MGDCKWICFAFVGEAMLYYNTCDFVVSAYLTGFIRSLLIKAVINSSHIDGRWTPIGGLEPYVVWTCVASVARKPGQERYDSWRQSSFLLVLVQKIIYWQCIE